VRRLDLKPVRAAHKQRVFPPLVGQLDLHGAELPPAGVQLDAATQRGGDRLVTVTNTEQRFLVFDHRADPPQQVISQRVVIHDRAPSTGDDPPISRIWIGGWLIGQPKNPTVDPDRLEHASKPGVVIPEPLDHARVRRAGLQYPNRSVGRGHDVSPLRPAGTASASRASRS
jgi:hypothetical protein